ncbi:TPA: VirD4-like conjugal transfer protein, CD1115 family [Bacillus nitratireducens]
MDKADISKAVVKNVPFVVGIDYASSLVVNALPMIPSMLKDVNQFEPFKAQMLSYLTDPVLNITHALQNDIYAQGQYGFLGFATYLVLKELWKHRKRAFKDGDKYGSHGTARWIRKGELFRDRAISSKLSPTSHYLGKMGLKHVLQTEKDEGNGMTLLSGGSGSGKTTAYIINNLLLSVMKSKQKNGVAGRSSFVVADPKGEIHNATSRTLAAAGYKIRVLNFRDLANTDFYNPFDYIFEDSDCLEVAQVYIQNTLEGQKKKDFWDKSEASLLAALMLYVRHCVPKEEQHFGSVFQLLMMKYEEIEAMFMAMPKEHIVHRAFKQAIDKLEDKVRSNVFQSLNVTMSLFLYENVVRFTSKSTFNLKSIGEELTAVFLVLPVVKNTYTPLISTFFTQMFNVLYDLAFESPTNKMPLKVKVLADEFCNLGKLHPEFTRILSTARGLGFSISMAIQDLSQLVDRWGIDKAKEIRSNCDVTMLLGTTDLDTAEFFSKRLGNTTIFVQSHSEHNDGESQGRSEQATGRTLMTPDEILNMNKHKAVVFIKGKNPILLKKGYWYKNKAFKKILQQYGSSDVNQYKAEGLVDYEYKVFQPNVVKLETEKVVLKKEEAKVLPKEKNEKIAVEKTEEELLFKI